MKNQKGEVVLAVMVVMMAVMFFSGTWGWGKDAIVTTTIMIKIMNIKKWTNLWM